MCMGASAISFQLRDDFCLNTNYYNCATRFVNEGIYIGAYSGYTMNMPRLSGKEPLDLNVDLSVARPKYTVFASVSHDERSYFDNICLSGGYNRIFRFNEHHTLKVGARAIMGVNSVDFFHLPYESPVDDDKSRIILTPDVDLGIEYVYRFFHLGLSVKNVIQTPGKFNGVTYVSFPRSYYGNILFDVKFLGGNIMLQPYLAMGFTQNVLLVAGTDIKFWQRYRIGYTFRAPDLHHNVFASVDICDRVILNAGYSVSGGHPYSTVFAGITVKLAK